MTAVQQYGIWKKGVEMSVLRWLSVCIAWCVSGTALAQPDVRANPEALQLVRTQFPKLRVDAASSGTLDKTSARYLAVILDDDDAYTTRLVLLGKTAGSWSILARTQSWQYGTAELWDVKIVSGMIELSDWASGGCCSHSKWMLKFRKYGKDFPLVGEELREVGSFDSRGGQALASVDRESVDWLSHQIIISQAVGKSNEGAVEDQLHIIAGKKRRTEKTMRFHSDMNWTLRNFDMRLFSDSTRKSLGL